MCHNEVAQLGLYLDVGRCAVVVPVCVVGFVRLLWQCVLQMVMGARGGAAEPGSMCK